jgi:dinuclear metal center YbgI/SA1388 family protein
MIRNELTGYLDTLLNTAAIGDASQNGLQVEGPLEIRKAAFAVDGSLATINAAAENSADILIVHHGIFWDKPVRAAGPLYKRLKALIDGNCALYASHLPLDLHAEVGNNAVIARLLGIKNPAPFGRYHGTTIGCGGELPSAASLADTAAALSAHTEAPCTLIDSGRKCSRVAIVSGGGSSLLEEAAGEGYDTFITGETSHSSYHYALELGVNMIFGGHYATERFGVMALKDRLAAQFGLETIFIDIPTGM